MTEHTFHQLSYYVYRPSSMGRWSQAFEDSFLKNFVPYEFCDPEQVTTLIHSPFSSLPRAYTFICEFCNNHLKSLLLLHILHILTLHGLYQEARWGVLKPFILLVAFSPPVRLKPPPPKGPHQSRDRLVCPGRISFISPGYEIITAKNIWHRHNGQQASIGRINFSWPVYLDIPGRRCWPPRTSRRDNLLKLVSLSGLGLGSAHLKNMQPPICRISPQASRAFGRRLAEVLEVTESLRRTEDK